MYRSTLLVLVLLLPALSQSTFAQTITTLSGARSDAKTSDEVVNREIKPAAKTLYKTAIALFDSGQYSQATETLQQVLQLAPDYADAHEALGRSYFKLREWQKAIDSFSRASSLNAKVRQEQDDLHKNLIARKADSVKTNESSNAPKTQVPAVATSQRTNPASPNPVVATASPTAERVSLKAPSPAATATTPNATPIAPIDDVSLTKTYRIGPGDVLDIRLNDPISDSKSTLFTITPTGQLEYPLLLEPLSVTGLTVDEVSVSIENELKQRALTENPRVAIGVRDYASHTILVSGLVKESGTKILRREAIPLYVVVADAQPLAEAAKVTVVRNETNQMYEIDLAQSASMNLLVRPGDVITLLPNETQFIYIGGEIKSPGEKQYRRGLTLTQALLSSGGLTPKAKFAEVGRDTGSGFLTVTRFKLAEIQSGKTADPLVKPGDRITVLR